MQSAHTPNLEALIFDELQEIFLLLETVPVNEMEKIIFLTDKVNNDSYQKLKKRNAGSISDETEIKLNQLLINNKTDRLYGLFQKYGRSGEDDRLGADEILTLMSYFSKKYIKENSVDLEKIHRVLEELDNFLSKNQLYNYGVTVLFSVIKLIKKEGLNTPETQEAQKLVEKFLSKPIPEDKASSPDIYLSKEEIETTMEQIKDDNFGVKKLFVAIKEALARQNIDGAIKALAALGENIAFLSDDSKKILGPLLFNEPLDDDSLKLILTIHSLDHAGIYSNPLLNQGAKIYATLVGEDRYNAAITSSIKGQVQEYSKEVRKAIGRWEAKKEIVSQIALLRKEAELAENAHDKQYIVNFADALEKKVVDSAEEDKTKYAKLNTFFDTEKAKINHLASVSLKDKIRLFILKIRKILDNVFNSKLLEDPATSIKSRYTFYKQSNARKKTIGTQMEKTKKLISQASKTNSPRKGRIN